MVKLPFQKTYEDTNKFLSLSITSRDVKCLSFYYDNDLFKIIGFGSQEIPKNSVRNGMVLDKDVVLEAIKSSVEKATEGMEDKPKKVLVGVDGGTTIGLTTTVKMKRQNSDPIQPQEIEALYKRITEASYIQARNKVLQNTGDPEMDLDTITTLDVYLKIDDQRVATLEGQRGSVIEAAVYNSFAPSFHISSLQSVVKKAGLEIIAIGSQMYSLVEWIKNPPKNSLDFVLINLAEDSTDVGVVFGGGIISSKTLNIGYSHFLDSISRKMGLSVKDTESVLKMYKVGKLAESEIVVVKECLSEILEIWIDGLKLLFEDFPGVKTFAPKIYLSGCGVDTPDISDAIKNEPWAKTIPFKAEPEFSKISFGDLEKISNSTGEKFSPDWIYTTATSTIYKVILGI